MRRTAARGYAKEFIPTDEEIVEGLKIRTLVLVCTMQIMML